MVTLPRGCTGRKSYPPSYIKFCFQVFLLLALTIFWTSYFLAWYYDDSPLNAEEIQARCRTLNTKPGPPSNFYARTVSDRFVEGTKHVWIRNATIWTGRVQGLEVIQGDVFLMNGIIKAVGHVDLRPMGLDSLNGIEILDARGAYVTPGYVCCHRLPFSSELKRLAHRIVDLHSHMGVESAPSLEGATDGNSLHGPIVSWLRTIDAIDTHDAAYELAVAGGVTTSLILPGSANAIGKCLFNIPPPTP